MPRSVVSLPLWMPDPEAEAKASIAIPNTATVVLLRQALQPLQPPESWTVFAVVQEVARNLAPRAESVQVCRLLPQDWVVLPSPACTSEVRLAKKP